MNKRGPPALQSPYWLIEVGAVLARASPGTAAEDVLTLDALELPIAADRDVLRRACEIAVALKQQLFDTFHHAVALEEPNGELVTADERYFRVARSLGGIMRLKSWESAPQAG